MPGIFDAPPGRWLVLSRLAAPQQSRMRTDISSARDKSTLIIRIAASFGPSTVRVNTETVYLDRREAGLVMTSLQFC